MIPVVTDGDRSHARTGSSDWKIALDAGSTAKVITDIAIRIFPPRIASRLTRSPNVTIDLGENR
jgi:hypothetical protein